MTLFQYHISWNSKIIISYRLVWNLLPKKVQKWSIFSDGWVRCARNISGFSCNSFFCFLDRLTNECEALKKQIRELTANIEEPFQGSKDELKLLISNFQRDQDKKKRELQDVRAFSIIIHNSFTTRQFYSGGRCVNPMNP
jgi:methyl-accepting chemotaxis protein